MDPRLDKIRKLMALALDNPSEEESRSAALKAVRLMRDYDCVVSIERVQPAQGYAGSWNTTPPAWSCQPEQAVNMDEQYQRIMNDLFGRRP